MAADGSVTGTAMGGGGELRPHGWRAPLSMVNGLGHVTEPCMEPSWEPWAGGSSSPIRNIWVEVLLGTSGWWSASIHVPSPRSSAGAWTKSRVDGSQHDKNKYHPSCRFGRFLSCDVACGQPGDTRAHRSTCTIPQAEKRQRIRSTCRVSSRRVRRDEIESSVGSPDSAPRSVWVSQGYASRYATLHAMLAFDRFAHRRPATI